MREQQAKAVEERKAKPKGKKDFSLISFGDEAEEEETLLNTVNVNDY